MKAIRALAASSTLLLASLIAHILAGGESLSPHSALTLVLISFLIATLLTRKCGDPIRVALAIFVAQNSSHLLLGGQPSSDSRMLFAHVAAGLFSYHLLRHFDNTLPDLGRAFALLLLRVLPRFIIEIALPLCGRQSTYRILTNQYLSTAFSLRGPPLP